MSEKDSLVFIEHILENINKVEDIEKESKNA